MKTCQKCSTMYALESSACPDCLSTVEAARRDARKHANRMARACLALMGGAGWRDNYDCDHGVPIGKDCAVPDCSLNPVRYVRDTITFYETGRTPERRPAPASAEGTPTTNKRTAA